FLIASLLLSTIGDHLVGTWTDDWSAFDHRTFVVSKIISADTICVGDISNPLTVRLVGVDAPASAYWIKKSKTYVEQRTLGKNVTLRLEPIQTRDRDGALRAYVYLSDLDCLNADLVHDGEVFADRQFAHTFQPQYEMAENDARRRERGLWYGVSDDDMPAWRVQWLRSLRARS
ncbi:MAG TPA: thermonuclease family protein, partial [Tepidisphaeraceae bacterium]